jgi:hypothetical protein
MSRGHKKFAHNPSVLSGQSDPTRYLSLVGSQASDRFWHLMGQHLRDPELAKMSAPQRAQELQRREHEVEDLVRHDLILQPVPE